MRHPYCRRQRASAHASDRRPKTAAPTEADLAPARVAVGTLLDSLGLSARLYAVEPREGRWAVIVECATDSGWQRAELQAGPELLAVIRGDAGARAALLAEWRTHLVACKTD
ncbi:MAG: hypothetical protein ACYC1G_14040 [Thiobacillus sp.]